MKVLKFGGSSLADAEQFRKVKNIVMADERRIYVIPSAPGKRFSGDTKVTDMLYECYNVAESGGDIDEIFSKVCDRYNSIIEGLGIDLDLSLEYQHIKWAILHHAGRDYAASRGEYLNGIILAKFLDYDFIDPSTYIKFFDNGTFDSEITNTLLSTELKKHKNGVIPGFYGSMPNGTIRTFSRGGSDITGSIVARAALADIYENWTDVSGFLSADPRIVDNPKGISFITYRELRELSYMGAGVLHEDAIFPVRFAGIPINIRNTNAPEDTGTMIVPCTDVFDSETVITGIAGKKGFSVITIEKAMMNSEKGFGRKVLEAIEKEGLSFEHLPSGIDTMCVVLHTEEINTCRDRLKNRICASVEPDSISIEDGLALIAVVGRSMVKAKGTAVRVFKAVADSEINIRMIDQGSSELNIIIGVDEKDFEKATNAIYHEFVK
ncbi:MAG: aspartate kinase [Ruminococcaceae bacterium]|nr:aspartate kinase [Oscillospiraceae bacterium]